VSIVFLDEIDAFAGSREQTMHEGTRRILPVLLRQMQGLVETVSVMVVGATNRADDLDAALTSRFARTIRFPLPDQREREAILAHYARTLAPAEIAQIAALAEGLSGRNLEDGWVSVSPLRSRSARAALPSAWRGCATAIGRSSGSATASMRASSFWLPGERDARTWTGCPGQQTPRTS